MGKFNTLLTIYPSSLPSGITYDQSVESIAIFDAAFGFYVYIKSLASNGTQEYWIVRLSTLLTPIRTAMKIDMPHSLYARK